MRCIPHGLVSCRWYDAVVAAEDDIAAIMTVESGKPLKESKGEFTSGCAPDQASCFPGCTEQRSAQSRPLLFSSHHMWMRVCVKYRSCCLGLFGYS